MSPGPFDRAKWEQRREYMRNPVDYDPETGMPLAEPHKTAPSQLSPSQPLPPEGEPLSPEEEKLARTRALAQLVHPEDCEEDEPPDPEEEKLAREQELNTVLDELADEAIDRISTLDPVPGPDLRSRGTHSNVWMDFASLALEGGKGGLPAEYVRMALECCQWVLGGLPVKRLEWLWRETAGNSAESGDPPRALSALTRPIAEEMLDRLVDVARGEEDTEEEDPDEEADLDETIRLFAGKLNPQPASETAKPQEPSPEPGSPPPPPEEKPEVQDDPLAPKSKDKLDASDDSTLAEWRRGRRDYLKHPSYSHPKYGTPLKEPYKPWNGREMLFRGRPASEYLGEKPEPDEPPSPPPPQEPSEEIAEDDPDWLELQEVIRRVRARKLPRLADLKKPPATESAKSCPERPRQHPAQPQKEEVVEQLRPDEAAEWVKRMMISSSGRGKPGSSQLSKHEAQHEPPETSAATPDCSVRIGIPDPSPDEPLEFKRMRDELEAKTAPLRGIIETFEGQKLAQFEAEAMGLRDIIAEPERQRKAALDKRLRPWERARAIACGFAVCLCIANLVAVVVMSKCNISSHHPTRYPAILLVSAFAAVFTLLPLLPWGLCKVIGVVCDWGERRLAQRVDQALSDLRWRAATATALLERITDDFERGSPAECEKSLTPLRLRAEAAAAELGKAKRDFERRYTAACDVYPGYPPDWSMRIAIVRHRDGHVCTKCGWPRGFRRRRRSLHVHHKKALSDGGSNRLDNLITLCYICHRKVDSKHKNVTRFPKR